MNTAKHLIRSARFAPSATAVALGPTPALSYAELASRSASIAGALRNSLGLEPGDRVALCLKNCVEYLELLFGCWHAGLVAVPMNAKLHPDEFAYMFDDCGAKVGFASAGLSDDIGQTGKLRELFEVPSAAYGRLLEHEPIEQCDRQADDLAWLFYTSGTTGRPKGAMISHRNLNSMCGCYFTDVDPGAPWRAIIHAAPMSHGSGLYGVAHVLQGSCHVIPQSGSFQPAEIAELVETFAGVSFFAAPTMVRRLLDSGVELNPSKLKSILYGGGPMYVEDCIEAMDRFGDDKLSQLYGQGESPMTITALNAAVHADRNHPRWRARLASVGIAQSAVEVRIADDDDRALADGEVGEILVRGDTVMRGYWNNPQASQQSLRGGWLHTGDVGSLDSDGFLTLKDRSKDMIISGGSNIYPREVEEVILRHPDVNEVSVIGRPDREWGEVVIAYVVAKSQSDLSATSLDTFCVENIARFKRPKEYLFIDSLPKNNYGKVLKTSLRERDAIKKA